jgi:aminopeptidase
MPDPRWDQLADILLNHSTRLQAGETILIECFDLDDDTLPRLLVRKAARKGAYPLVELKDNRIVRELVRNGSEPQMRAWGEAERFRMERVQAYLGLRGARNVNELADVPPEKLEHYNAHVLKPVHFDRRIKHTRWCVLRLPNASMAQQAGMSTEAFEDFYFDVCTLDYGKMSRAMRPLVELMQRTDRVRLKGPGETDLTFSVRGIPAIPCDGKVNIPDGEVFTAPRRESINGVIRFNAPTIYRGVTHNDIRLVFKNGKIVEATSTATDKLNDVLNADEGARYIGEFAIGFNPYCTKPMKDILFDEKIAGSIHFTPGQCYDEASNGNKSNIHWDLVMRQTPDVGGGEMWFDNKLVRKDGRFVVPDLEALNPENLT